MFPCRSLSLQGTHTSLKGNSHALSTVTAIIDGTGSVGAAVGPLLAGLLSPYGWHNVFVMLMISDACALLVSTDPFILLIIPLNIDPIIPVSTNTSV
ncbi:hypothetical protein FKM82_029016 [Ascaphus truei]